MKALIKNDHKLGGAKMCEAINKLFKYGSLVLALCVLVNPTDLWARGGKKKPKKAAPKKRVYSWDAKPTIEQIYDKYMPKFSRAKAAKGIKVKFSRQRHYLNISDVKMDAQVWPIIKKANELMDKKKEYRKATEYYLRIMKDYRGELCQVSKEGIFIPSTLYVQRRILMYPKKELSYFRILFDPAAKEIFTRAVRRYSIPDYKDLVQYHLATSYGDDALFALGNAALDNGRYNEARRYYERIITYHGFADEDKDKINLDRDQIWVRLAICFKHLGDNQAFAHILKRIKNKTESSVAKLLAQLAQFKFDAYAVMQRENRRSSRFDALDDRRLSATMPYEFPANNGEWRIPLGRRRWFFEPEALPWITETDIIYKDLNVLYSRSILTGELNWAFGPGGSSRDWDWYTGGWPGVYTNYYPEQSILVHDGAVFAHQFVYGPSLVCVDQYTGRRLWAKGPMAATTEDEWLDRFQASPAAGRGTVIVPIVHDDIRGRSHISSSSELAAYETRSGKLVWRTKLTRIAPLKITQSRYPRKIRIFSSTPLVKEGVVYHSTNAGAIAAVDAQTGDIRWMTRYPQNKKVMDNFSNPGKTWRNTAPMIRGRKLYVTPVDTGFLLCLDTETGKILWTATQSSDSRWGTRNRAGKFPGMWRMNGFAHDGSICLSGGDITFLDPDSGQVKWTTRISGGGWLGGQVVPFGSYKRNKRSPLPKGYECGIDGEGNDFWWPPGIIETRPLITKSGVMYFSTRGIKQETGGQFYSNFTMDLKTKTITSQRRWYSPRGYVYDQQRMPPISKRVVNEEPEAFGVATRMTVNRWNVPFEINIHNNKMVVRYDRKKLDAILLKSNDLDSLFAKAEVARKNGQVKKAIKLYESCKPLLPSEEEDRRRNINLRLFPLYIELARWAHQAADFALLEHACKNMGATASNPMQEIRALLAYSELHEKRGDFVQAAAVLQNASRHYWREPIRVSGLQMGNREELLATTEVAMKNLLEEIPNNYAIVTEQTGRSESAAILDYFLSIANTDRDYVVETRSLIAQKLRALRSRAPEAFKKQYDSLAGTDLKKYADPSVGERLLWCWPESNAAQNKLQAFSQNVNGKHATEKQNKQWRFHDLAKACGFEPSSVSNGIKGLKLAPTPVLSSGAGLSVKETKNEDPDMVRLVLPQFGETTATSHLLFAGGRKRRAYGNRFNVLCWDLKADKKAWQSQGLLLHSNSSGGEGYEVGFEKIFVHKNLAIVHGRYDVVALDWRAGENMRQDGKKEKKWHFRVPLGFEIKSTGIFGETLILVGRRSTLALSPITGEIIWDAPEVGELYAGPYFYKDVAFTVRKSPAEVSFRRVGSGRLLSRLSLPGLTTNRKHPVFAGEGGQQNPAAAQSAEANPVACAEGYLAISDGQSYHVVDLEHQQLLWSRRATKLDPSVDASYRMWIHDGVLLVLKPYYSVLENVVFNVKTGEMLWRRREGGKKQEKALAKFEGKDSKGKAATGLVLTSMTFVNNIAYGIKYQMSSTTVAMVGMDPKTGNQVMSTVSKGFDEPEAYVEPSWSKDCVVVRIQDGNKYELWQVDVNAKKPVQKIKLDGYGRFGEYGDASGVWQGPYIGLWAFEKRKFSK